ncbi:MAG: BolA/IbaG family iron-sulfur metabolism protein [Pseudomonadota bacterium]
MMLQNSIEKKLSALEPFHLEVINESHQHNVPPNSETHFKVIIVSDKFEGAGLVGRHRMVNAQLAEELAGGVHALALHTMTPDEWFEKGGSSPDSPDCLGGSAKSG